MAVKTVKVDLPAEIFDVEVNIPLIHQVVVAQQAAARQGTHSTKTRADVRGGGRKPYKQKGTGRARQGSTRAPQFAGGGVVHGPQPRNYDQRTPKKMKAAALRGALSDRARNGRVHVVDSLVSGDKPSTKAALAALVSLTDRVGYLVVLERSDAITWLSLRNAPEVHIVAVDQLNTYDVLNSRRRGLHQGCLRRLRGWHVRPGQGRRRPRSPPRPRRPRPRAEVTAFADVPAADEAPALPKGAKAPLKSGNAPKGYEVKGNADSGLYHEPDGQWYDATEPEFWFKSAEDAEAAGFTRAGGGSAKEDDK